MLERFLTPGSPAMQLAVAGLILAGFLGAMLLVQLSWRRVLAPMVKRTDTDLDDLVLPPFRGLVLWGIFLTGIYHSTASFAFLEGNAAAKALIAKGLSLAWLALAIWTLLRVFNGMVAWYVRKASERSEGSHDISHQANLLQKVVNAILLAIGLIYALRVAGVDISPLLASGAIGGLAVALALQDTLSNFFAGLFMAIDRPIKVGDYVMLETGEEGFVEEIGWRNTRVRPWANNLLIIPNASLSKSRITNYYLPQQEMSVYVKCGIAYDSDLQFVEDVTVQVAREVMARIDGADKEWEPVVRWKEFGDSSINFLAVLRVKEFGAQYLLQSEFVKALHKRYGEAGIEIPFPIRTLVMKQPSGNGAAAALEGARSGDRPERIPDRPGQQSLANEAGPVEPGQLPAAAPEGAGQAVPPGR